MHARRRFASQGGALVPYLLDEPKGFATTGANLRASLAAARRANPKLNARAVVVINPGNPTGSIMTEADMRDVVCKCARGSWVWVNMVMGPRSKRCLRT